MKRALLVGVDVYDNFNPLDGCVNDAELMADVLDRHQEPRTPNFSCVTLPNAGDGRVHTDELKGAIADCFAPGATVALFFYAGHGRGQDGDTVTMCTSDGTELSPGVEFDYVLDQIRKSPVQEKVVILDCCYSGGAGGVSALGLDGAAVLPEGTTILAASRGDQVAMETDGAQGLFTSYLYAGLEGGAADVRGRVTSAGLYSFLNQSFDAWEQRPVLRANIDRLEVIRQCSPYVSHDDLLSLADLFPDVSARLALDPSYEPTAEPKDDVNEASFKVLQNCRNGKLIASDDHLYFEAMNNGSCRLTPLGRHYCRLVHEGLL